MIHVDGKARGCDHKCLLGDSNFRSKFWLLSLLLELAHSGLHIWDGPLPPPELTSVRYEHSPKAGGCFPGNYEGPLPLTLGGVILYRPLLAGILMLMKATSLDSPNTDPITMWQ